MKKTLKFYTCFFSTVEYFSGVLEKLSIPFNTSFYKNEYVFNFYVTQAQANDIDTLLLADQKFIGWYSFAAQFRGLFEWIERE